MIDVFLLSDEFRTNRFVVIFLTVAHLCLAGIACTYHIESSTSIYFNEADVADVFVEGYII